MTYHLKLNITFTPLSESHFPLLLKWLEAPHVKLWWDKEIIWTLNLVKQKYESYIKGYKLLKLHNKIVKKPIHVFIINFNDVPVGYIQYYNKHDFLDEENSIKIAESSAALDYFILVN